MGNTKKYRKKMHGGTTRSPSSSEPSVLRLTDNDLTVEGIIALKDKVRRFTINDIFRLSLKIISYAASPVTVKPLFYGDIHSLEKGEQGTILEMASIINQALATRVQIPEQMLPAFKYIKARSNDILAYYIKDQIRENQPIILRNGINIHTEEAIKNYTKIYNNKMSIITSYVYIVIQNRATREGRSLENEYGYISIGDEIFEYKTLTNVDSAGNTGINGIVFFKDGESIPKRVFWNKVNTYPGVIYISDNKEILERKRKLNHRNGGRSRTTQKNRRYSNK